MKPTDEQIEKAAKAIRPWAFRELSYSERMSDDYAVARQRHAQEQARDLARAALEAVMPEGNQNGPDWEGFGRAVMADWPEGGGIDGFTLQDMAVEHGLLREVPGGFNPEEHIDVTCCAEPGDVWFEVTFPSNRDGNRKPASEPGELELLREALASAGRSLEWAARRMKDNCCRDSDVAAVRLAAGKTTEARAALGEGGRDE